VSIHALGLTQEDLYMAKSTLTDRQMGAAEFVERAAGWSRELTRFRARGPGDLENAMRAIERDYGIPYWITWRLRYRLSQIKDLGCEPYHRIKAAYECECEAQRRKLELQCKQTTAARGADNALVLQTEAFLRSTATPEDNAEDISSECQNPVGIDDKARERSQPS